MVVTEMNTRKQRSKNGFVCNNYENSLFLVFLLDGRSCRQRGSPESKPVDAPHAETA